MFSAFEKGQFVAGEFKEDKSKHSSKIINNAGKLPYSRDSFVDLQSQKRLFLFINAALLFLD